MRPRVVTEPTHAARTISGRAGAAPLREQVVWVSAETADCGRPRAVGHAPQVRPVLVRFPGEVDSAGSKMIVTSTWSVPTQRRILTQSKKRARLRAMATTSDFQEMLRGAALRVTRPRLAVLDAVQHNPHVDTDSIISAVRVD